LTWGLSRGGWGSRRKGGHGSADEQNSRRARCHEVFKRIKKLNKNGGCGGKFRVRSWAVGSSTGLNKSKKQEKDKGEKKTE